MKSIYKYSIAGVVLAVLAFVVYNKVYIPKTTYKTVQSTRGDMSVKIFGIGQVGAKTIYNVTAGVNAKLLTVGTDEGKWVKKGQLLATFDSVDLPMLVQEANISVQKSQSEYLASKKELESLKAQKTLALVTYKRYKKLKDESFVSQSEYDKANSDLKVIEGQISVTKAHIKSSKIEITRAKKNVEALKEKLSRYKVYAPVDGYVIAKKADVAQTLGATQVMFEIVTTNDVWVKAYVDERISGDVKVGAKASIKLRSSTKQFKGYVKRIAPQSDAVTQEREVDVAFKNLPIPFYINEQAEVLVDAKQLNNVVIVPAVALVYKESVSGVWVKNADKAHFQKVEVLGVSDSKVAVKNLEGGAVLLLASTKNKTLKEGMKVH